MMRPVSTNLIVPSRTSVCQAGLPTSVTLFAISFAVSTFVPTGAIVVGGHHGVAVAWQMPETTVEFAPQTAVTFIDARVAPAFVMATLVVPSEMENVAEPDGSVETVAPPEVRRGDVAFEVVQLADALHEDAPSGTVQPDAVSVPVAGLLGVGTAVPPSPPPPHAVSTRARAKTARMAAKRPGLMFMKKFFMILFLSAAFRGNG